MPRLSARSKASCAAVPNCSALSLVHGGSKSEQARSLQGTYCEAGSPEKRRPSNPPVNRSLYAVMVAPGTEQGVNADQGLPPGHPIETRALE